MTCRNCQNSLTEKASFCNKCGASVIIIEPTPIAQPPPILRPVYPQYQQPQQPNNVLKIVVGVLVVIGIIFFLSNWDIFSQLTNPTMAGTWSRSSSSGNLPLVMPQNIVFTAGSDNTSGAGHFIGGITGIRHNFNWTLQGGTFTMTRFPGDLEVFSVVMAVQGSRLTFTYPNGSSVTFTRQ
ncbi:MAG: hypothetical protein FWG65_04890 [Turicibacter sp.]|nr:hypothetical protein [Turicibacter sp.]